MVVLFGRNFPESLYVASALKSFFGIGDDVCARIMARHYIHKSAKMNWLTNRHIVDLNGDLNGLHIENHLKREINTNIERLRDMKCYRGLRHAFNLPVRGQRTRGQIATATRLNVIPRHKLT